MACLTVRTKFSGVLGGKKISVPAPQKVRDIVRTSFSS